MAEKGPDHRKRQAMCEADAREEGGERSERAVGHIRPILHGQVEFRYVGGRNISDLQPTERDPELADPGFALSGTALHLGLTEEAPILGSGRRFELGVSMLKERIRQTRHGWRDEPRMTRSTLPTACRRYLLAGSAW
jgi:hypothetical protein